MLYSCPVVGCKNRTTTPGKCAKCVTSQRKRTDRRRGSSTERGYGSEHRKARAEVLAKWPTCMCREDCHWHSRGDYNGLCGLESVVADHYPWTKRELHSVGRNDNDPVYMRGLCVRCHNRHTGKTSPGGFGK